MRVHGSATAPTPESLSALRADTPGCEEVIHFNNAGCGLLAAPTLATMVTHLQLEAQLGGYEASDHAADQVRTFYTELAALIGCGPHNIAFSGSATHAYATALSSIPFERGDIILTTRNDFISNQIAFLSLRKRFGVEIVHAPDLPEGGVDVTAMVALMKARRPRLVAATHIPTNSGLVQPVAEIGRHCRELDLLYLVDACQSVGQYPLDVEEIGCDLLTGTCRKFLRGPRGSGFLFVSDRVLEAGYEPLFLDMRGADWSTADGYTPARTAARFEEWEFPYATLLGCATAVRYAREVGIEAISVRTPELARQLRDGLDALPGIRALDRGSKLGALVTIAVEGWSAEAFKKELDARGINSALSFRRFAQFDFGDKDVDWSVRFSPHYYNTEAELAQVVAAVNELTTATKSRLQ
ncbi:aminotransferase class V-fold PLP-dependent enzyme [Kribbella sp. NPDC055071]